MIGVPIEIETAGVLPMGRLSLEQIQWNVSPKLSHSGNSYSMRYKPQYLREFARKGAAFKFVVRDAADLIEVEDIVSDCFINPRNVWIMPEGTTIEDILEGARNIEEEVKCRHWNLSLRMQTLLWGQARAR